MALMITSAPYSCPKLSRLSSCCHQKLLVALLIICPSLLMLCNDRALKDRIRENVQSSFASPVSPSLNTTTGKLYTCGWPREDRFYQYLFPEYTDREKLSEDTPLNQTDSAFLVHGFSGPCYDNRDEFWIATNWKGRVLVVNTEGEISIGRIPSTLNRIGYEQDSDRSVHVLIGAMLLVADGHYTSDEVESLLDPARKRQSSGQSFCIYANSNCVWYREDAADMLSTRVAPVDRGGRCGGTNGNLLLDRTYLKEREWKNVDLFSGYRFCMVMENKNLKGYVTEKIINAFVAGCIPIYYGTEDIFDVFNHRAFIFWDIHHPETSLQKVMYLEHNKSAYREMLQNEPILADGENTIRKYFSFADHVGGGHLKKKIRQLVHLPV